MNNKQIYITNKKSTPKRKYIFASNYLQVRHRFRSNLLNSILLNKYTVNYEELSERIHQILSDYFYTKQKITYTFLYNILQKNV